MTKINNFLCKLLPLLKSHAEYSRKTADDFNELVLEVEDILLDVEAPNNQVPEEEEYDLDKLQDIRHSVPTDLQSLSINIKSLLLNAVESVSGHGTSNISSAESIAAKSAWQFLS